MSDCHSFCWPFALSSSSKCDGGVLSRGEGVLTRSDQVSPNLGWTTPLILIVV